MSKDSGTRSSLLWECAKAIETKRPRYLISENVPQCVNADLVPISIPFSTIHPNVAAGKIDRNGRSKRTPTNDLNDM